MKKLLLLVLVLLLSSCEKEQTLYVLNWGSYINMDTVAAFEEEYGVKVVVDEVETTSAMYEKIKSGTTAYDIVVPTDYMVQKMMNENLLIELDFNRITTLERFDVINNALAADHIEQYAIPYYFGSLGLLYNLEYQDLVEEYGWAVLFDESIWPEGLRVGQFASSRDATATAAFYLGYSANTTAPAELAEIERVLSDTNYAVWGEDNLKQELVAGNLDIVMTYSGDYFDMYYTVTSEGDEVDFGYEVPMVNNIWVDNMVIPITSEETDLAYDFINYFLEADNVVWNTEYVGYATPYVVPYEMMLADSSWDEITSQENFVDIFLRDDFKGEVFQDLGSAHYQTLEEIITRARQE